MSYEFDFNINSYSISDLENFLSLNENYDLNEINNKCSKLSNIIIESKEYDKIYKTRLGHFLEQAKLKLVKTIKEISQCDNVSIDDYNKLIIPTDHTINQTSTTYAGHTYVMNKETVSLNDVINKDKFLNPISVMPTNIQRGQLNEIKRKTILQTVVINTLFREDYFNTSSTDFNIVIPYYFKNVLSLRLSSLQLPNVMYTVSNLNGNNTFYIEENTTGLSETIVFPNGNYNDISQFCTLLEDVINTQLGISPYRFNVNYDPNSYNITISNTTYDFLLIFNIPTDTITGKCKQKFKPTDGQRKQNCVEIDEIYKKFGWIIGFRGASYSGSNSYTTESLYNGFYPNYIYFVLDDFNNSQAQNVFGMYSKSIIGDNILGMIPITNSSFYTNFTNGSDLIEKKREYFGPVRIQRLKIQLLNQYGDIINLNNMDYSFSLELEIGYDI